MSGAGGVIDEERGGGKRSNSHGVRVGELEVRGHVHSGRHSEEGRGTVDAAPLGLILWRDLNP
jgi:hypothetical protein